MADLFQQPGHFLEVRVHFITPEPGLTGLCAGYEEGLWRADALTRHLIEWLPEFALTYREIEELGPHNAVSLISRAAYTVYTSKKYKRRGEIGELLLHIAIRQVFNTIPAISKYYYKDSSNDTVKGFDSVHVVATPDELELWLGEVKFYEDINDAMRDAVKELHDHTEREYMRGEFALISNKIDRSWPYSDKLLRLLNKNTSLDEVFDCLTIPVFLAYESSTVTNHTAITEAYKRDFYNEVTSNHDKFCNKDIPKKMRIHLFLFPIMDKQNLLDRFDERLKACQLMGQ